MKSKEKMDKFYDIHRPSYSIFILYRYFKKSIKRRVSSRKQFNDKIKITISGIIQGAKCYISETQSQEVYNVSFQRLVRGLNAYKNLIFYSMEIRKCMK